MKLGLSSYGVIKALEQKGITSDNFDENILKVIAIAIEENNKDLESKISEKVASDSLNKIRRMD